MNTEKLRELLGAATPGPWSVVADPSHYHTLSTVVGGYRGLRDFQFRAEIGGQASWKEQEANAALIVAAVNALPALLARLEAAERVVEAGRRVTAAFRALGETTAWTRAAEQARHECEAAMLALDAALEQEEGRG